MGRRARLSIMAGDAMHCASRELAPRPRQRGFTLVELMITLAVAVILTAIAVPSFRNLTLSNRLTTTANDIVGALNVARMEAVKRNASVQFCSNDSTANGSDTLGALCASDGGGAGGAVVTSINGADTQLVQATNMGLGSGIQLNGSMKAVRFNGQGLGYDPTSMAAPFGGTVADICTTSLSSDNHRVVSITAGSIVQVDTTTSSTCQ
ncbi:prepilin-type N-terminal cleavage/methylation domain-containing protein [Rhodanobacter glycinis]|uniref:Type II secretion system protein H n=2 Tax=Rhodanobacter glycinis TaxID=582702 RepID=A0A5B9DY10_9GAMM|nr:prepilin-type N-terminal cleavage/methylation domain-containing protein [Rhodanobacter glycinis]